MITFCRLQRVPEGMLVVLATLISDFSVMNRFQEGWSGHLMLLKLVTCEPCLRYKGWGDVLESGIHLQVSYVLIDGVDVVLEVVELVDAAQVDGGMLL